MTPIFAEQALLADGWADDVRLTVERGTIAAIQTGAEPRSGDARVGMLVPGICNAHSHAFQRALAGRTERHGPDRTDTFWTWRQLMYSLADRIGPSELTAIARQLYVEMLAAGYTSVVEFHYLHRASDKRVPSTAMLEALLTAATDSGIRMTYVPILYERGDFNEQELSPQQEGFALSLDNYLVHYQEALQLIEGPHAIGLGAHSLRAVSRASLEILAGQAEADDVPLHLHIAEQQREVDGCLGACSARPVRWLLDNFAVDQRWTLVHATHMDADEVRLLAESGAVACLCPSTEGNLGDGFFKLQDYLHRGGTFSIGSDSHVTINPFEELRWLEYGQRLLRQQRNVAAQNENSTGASLFSAAVEGGARSAGRSSAGLAPGVDADLLTLDAQNPMLLGHGGDTALDALVFSGLPLPIDNVMVNGVWTVRDGAHGATAVALADYAAALHRLGMPRP
jgi:formimidoylglutamate deiminase